MSDRPHELLEVRRGQTAVLLDELLQRNALEIVHHEVRPGSAAGVDVPTVRHSHEGGIFQLAEQRGFAEDVLDAPLQLVLEERLDYLEVPHVAVLAEERHAKPAGPKDAERLVASQRERGKSSGIQAKRVAQLLKRGLPVAVLKCGSVGADVRLCLRPRLYEETGSGFHVSLSSYNVPRGCLENAQ